MAETMLAVVAKGPYKVAVEERPIPQIQQPGDVVVKVTTSALCGSDLHIYHGVMPFPTWDFILGHELVGIVDKVGDGVKKFKKGDRVVSAFTTSCRECFFCTRGLTCRCEKCQTFGTPGLDGVQATYARIPMADGTLFKAPDDLRDEDLILLSDILPTGYSVAKTAWRFLPDEAKQFDCSVAVLGCGPVGICGVLAAKQKFKTVFAIDSVQERLDLAKKAGAIPINLTESPIEAIKAQTGGRGPDAVLEIVGSPEALDLALNLVRVGGIISSCGLQHKELKINGLQLYLKNVVMKFGRTSVIDLHEECLELLRKLVKEGALEGFVEKSVQIESATEYYELFDKRKIGKVVFQTQKK